MKTAVFSTKAYDRSFLDAANREQGHELVYFLPALDEETVPLAADFPAVCVFVNDRITAPVVEALAAGGTKLIALRCAGFNQVDLDAAEGAGLTVVRVPAYSPYAVAEHVIALLQAVNRRIHRAYNRVREGNFSLDGLLGFDLHGKTFGIVGTGKIGAVLARIAHGFGCRVLAHDVREDPKVAALGTTYTDLESLFAESDIVSLHCPLLPQTKHLVNQESLGRMKPGATLINTSRGGLVDTSAVIEALKSGRLAGLGLDVYEEEADLFFEDLSATIIKDDVFMRLTTFPNVVITGHQAYFTREALENIAATTIANITAFAEGRKPENAVFPAAVRPGN
ncbi:MAG: 2-hydroxyacid dehydrogenase [Puniceicoccaceae bacterium]|nr:MAG: 2-hydroxyacid dehydrogenase [Puniceicoccaceae bacterium]